MNNIKSADENSSGLRWLVLDMNSFFASCEQQENPHLRGKPVAIVPLLADTTCAIAASYEAKAFGIKTGTIVHDAKKMCPHLQLVQARPKLYVEYHHRFIEAIETCAPVEDVMSIDEIACRLDRTQQNPAIASHLARDMKEAIKQRAGVCLTSSVGIAANKLLAKLASDMQKPDGLVILNPADMPTPILKLEIEDICGIGPNMATRLHANGIQTIDDLWSADAQFLRRAWGGITGLRFHALLHGADLPSPSHPRRSLSHQHVLAPEQRSIETSTPVIRQLLLRAAQRLRDDGFYARRLIVQIKWDKFLGYWDQEQSFQETQDSGFLLQILMSLWQKAPKLRPLRIGVVLADLTAPNTHQFDLFEKRRPTALTSALDKINGKFGRDTVTYGCALPKMTSKIAFQRVPDLSEL